MNEISQELREMDMKHDNTLTIGISVEPNDGPELYRIVRPIKTLAGNNLVWEAVGARLIEEWKGFKRETAKTKAKFAAVSYGYWRRKGHEKPDCWGNLR